MAGFAFSKDVAESFAFKRVVPRRGVGVAIRRGAAGLLLALLAACSPYAQQIKQLDSAYQAGRIAPGEYHYVRANLVANEMQWRANIGAAMANTNAQLQRQQEIDAYNTRTSLMTSPRFLNIHHSGQIQHQHGGAIGIYPY